MYTQVDLTVADDTIKEILIALLSEEGYEGFEETTEGLNAFISSELYNKETLNSIVAPYNVSFKAEGVEKKNWNEEWEKNFQPVVVDDFCTIRAAFHDMAVTTAHEIVITPKMSFGTGHHATTFLMMRKMRSLDFGNKQVLDFGTGTGILAILAEKLGAAEVNAVDNEEWAFINAQENGEGNGCKNVKFWQGSLEDVPQKEYDIILANINRHILLQYMEQLSTLLSAGGTILLSGILSEDEDIITSSAVSVRLKKTDRQELRNWLVLEFIKD
ncbi:50S ribosomal protein L11 methyltransferase [Polluticoccus soli]|uniref:50S ribosomal protein L11 methyltransferase n=1 Tax=Polluticoccus soli TaxID=3034150 RepID=UPI0023E0ED90|nr:50S ribosomal protein L11 methyltransferase [Flavipsychrobacter sp. JY13-12]